MADDAIENVLEPLWQDVAAQASLPRRNADAFFRGLCSFYRKPDRAYHNLHHIALMLRTVFELESLLREPVEVRLAVWFHDCICDSHRADNEELSVAYMNAVLCDEQYALLRPRLAELILATKTHQARWGDIDCQVLLDADLAVFGSPPDDYDRYARAIRAEYAWVLDAHYRAGRRRVLESFLSRDQIYQTVPMRAAYEAAARANLRREIETLEISRL